MDLNPFLPILPVPPLLPPPPEQQQSHHQIPFLPHPNLNEEIHLINQENHFISPLPPPPPPPPANLQEVHIAQLATASPPKHAPTHLNHPPYAEMIIAAITSLNEKKGSSKKAIAKFIDSTYTNLPQSHSALLTHHLGRLKKNGLVIMIKHSYKLPNNKSSSSSSPLPLLPPTTTTTSSEGSGLLGKRGRGRPPKPKSINGSIVQPKKGRGRPPKPKSINGSIMQPNKGRGRPPKSASKPIAVTGSRPRGRPRKVDSGTAVLLLPGVVVFEDQNTVVGSSSTGRPVGRPRKTTVTSPSVDGGVLKPNPVTRAGGRSVGRPRKDGGGGGRSSSRLAKQQPIKVSSGRPVGRPRKDGSRIIVKPKTKSISTTGRPVGRPRKDNKIRVSVSSGRPVGRPRKENGSPVGEPVKEDETRVLSRRPVGRPPKKVGVVKPVSTGKPVGRPRKVRIVEVPPEEMEVVGLINGVNE